MRDRLILAAVLFGIGYAITFLVGWWFPWTSIVVGVLLLVVTVLALFDADTRAAMGFAGFLGFAVFGFLLFRSGRAELRNNAAITAEVEKIGQRITLAETTLAQGQIDDAIRLCVELEPKVGKDQKARLEQVKARAENRFMERTASDVRNLIESEDFGTAEAKIRAVLNEPEATRRVPASKLLETILLETIFKEREKVANKKLADIVAEAQAEFNAGRLIQTEKLLNQAQGLAHATELGDFNQLKVNVEAAIRDEQRKKEEIAKLRQREKEKAPPANANRRKVTKEEFGDKWPLTVDEGEIECIQKSPRISIRLFHHGGKTYALNGIAQSLGYPPIDPIWKNDRKLGAGVKISMHPLNEVADELCEGSR